MNGYDEELPREDEEYDSCYGCGFTDSTICDGCGYCFDCIMDPSSDASRGHRESCGLGENDE